MPLAGVVPYGQPGSPRPAPKYGPSGPFVGGGGGKTNRQAVEGAKAYKAALGLPDWQDVLGRLGGGGSTREFGNAGLAGEGASWLKGELASSRAALAKQQGNIATARGAIKNPTAQRGFQNVMRLTNERLGQAAEAERRQAADAASRRGYVGGYSGERTDQARRESLATAGYEAAAAERAAQQELLGAETGLYGSMLGGYGDLLSGYTGLTKTAAELPTKWLDSYSSLLSGLGGNFGDIFSTASRNVQFDTANSREDRSYNRRLIQDERARLRGTPGASGYA